MLHTVQEFELIDGLRKVAELLKDGTLEDEARSVAVQAGMSFLFVKTTYPENI